MQLDFRKYHGAGNDFILVDDRAGADFPTNDVEWIARLCDRHFGIGADGLILLRNHPAYDFEMIYFNSDGRPSTMCGNGGRCIVAFARDLGIIRTAECRFLAADGPHGARLLPNGRVALQMTDVAEIETGEDFFFLDTGSPHYVRFVTDLAGVAVVPAARAIRYGDRFRTAGTNVNFVEPLATGLRIATYERGVEDETLACGTGVTAAALAHAARHKQYGPQAITVQAKGGMLEVRFDYRADAGFQNVWLHGPAEFVFSGTWGG
jgi:diaminopimelate epimerase